MTGQLAQATQAHTFAVTTAGADEVTASCEATLKHLGRVVEAVGFSQNRNLTGAYWERVEQIMPLREVSVSYWITPGLQVTWLVHVWYERNTNGAAVSTGNRPVTSFAGLRMAFTWQNGLVFKLWIVGEQSPLPFKKRTANAHRQLCLQSRCLWIQSRPSTPGSQGCSPKRVHDRSQACCRP